MNCRLLIVEQRMLREGIRALLPAGFETVAETSSADEAVVLALRTYPDVAVLGLPLPEVQPCLLITKLRAEVPELKIMVISAVDSTDLIISIIRAGGLGFISKSAPPEELVAGLERVATGHFFLGPIAASRVAEFIHRGGQGRLSGREQQVLEEVALGFSSKEIAGRLQLEESTIRSYRKTLMRKLGVQNVAGLLLAANREGLLQPDTPQKE